MLDILCVDMNNVETLPECSHICKYSYNDLKTFRDLASFFSVFKLCFAISYFNLFLSAYVNCSEVSTVAFPYRLIMYT